jgi:signal transduction histidine kinase
MRETRAPAEVFFRDTSEVDVRAGLALPSRLPERAVATSCVVSVTALGLLTAVVAARGRGGAAAVAGAPAWPLVAGALAATVMALGAWSILRQAPSASVSLTLAAAGAVLPLWASVRWLPAGGRAALLALPPLVVGGAYQAARRWGDPFGRSAPQERIVWSLVAGAVLVHLAAYNPFTDPGCARTCLDAVVPLREVLTSREAVALTAALTVAGGVAALLLGRKPAWQAPPPVRVAASGSVVLATATAATRWLTWGAPAPSAVLPLVDLTAATVLAVGITVHARATVRTRAAVDRLVGALSVTASGPDRFGAGIADVHFSMPHDADRWIDPAGQDTAAHPAADRCVVLRDGKGPVVRLVLRRRTDAAEALADLGAGNRLALQNARLVAVARAHLADVQRSQRRVVVMADTERRRIERDLHDGAQQRLVGATFHLRIALGRVDARTAALLEHADHRIRDALTHLRRLAHGLFPDAAVEEGLEVALAELVAVSEMPVDLDVTCTGEVEPDAARTAYYTVADLLGYVLRPTPGTHLAIQVRQRQHALTIEAHLDPAGAPVLPAQLIDVVDRVGASGGHANVTGRDDSTLDLKAVIPCVS